jgi:hypothetical protein
MYRNVKWLSLLLLALAPAAHGQAAPDLFGRGGGDAEQPLDVEIRTKLDFSRATVAGSAGGKISVDPHSGNRSVSGDVVDLGGSALAGAAIVRGQPGRAIRIDMPASIRMTSASGGAIEIVNLRTNLPSAPRLDSYGKLEFTFGGDLLVRGNISGSFRGRIPITAEYE